MNMKPLLIGAQLLMTGTAIQSATASEFDLLRVAITPEIQLFEGTINGQPVQIKRNQDTGNLINPAFARTSRPCPPFCIQPMTLSSGIETVGELEVIEYLEKMANGDDSILVIDSRTPDWVAKGSIPGAVNIPWSKLDIDQGGADPLTIGEILTEQFGARETDVEDQWDFSDAKTLVMFCNGSWCGQSPTNIITLVRMGYPADKLKWYRGGMQAWEVLGLSTSN